MSEKKTSPETSETTPTQEPVVVGPIETQQQALQVLVSGLQVAQSRGALRSKNLRDWQRLSSFFNQLRIKSQRLNK